MRQPTVCLSQVPLQGQVTQLSLQASGYTCQYRERGIVSWLPSLPMKSTWITSTNLVPPTWTPIPLPSTGTRPQTPSGSGENNKDTQSMPHIPRHHKDSPGPHTLTSSATLGDSLRDTPSLSDWAHSTEVTLERRYPLSSASVPFSSSRGWGGGDECRG